MRVLARKPLDFDPQLYSQITRRAQEATRFNVSTLDYTLQRGCRYPPQ